MLFCHSFCKHQALSVARHYTMVLLRHKSVLNLNEFIKSYIPAIYVSEWVCIVIM